MYGRKSTYDFTALQFCIPSFIHSLYLPWQLPLLTWAKEHWLFFADGSPSLRSVSFPDILTQHYAPDSASFDSPTTYSSLRGRALSTSALHDHTVQQVDCNSASSSQALFTNQYTDLQPSPYIDNFNLSVRYQGAPHDVNNFWFDPLYSPGSDIALARPYDPSHQIDLKGKGREVPNFSGQNSQTFGAFQLSRTQDGQTRQQAEQTGLYRADNSHHNLGRYYPSTPQLQQHPALRTATSYQGQGQSDLQDNSIVRPAYSQYQGNNSQSQHENMGVIEENGFPSRKG